ncbi:hypothetical protein CDIK_4206, partial [Cucumispora dikerogammari]
SSTAFLKSEVCLISLGVSNDGLTLLLSFFCKSVLKELFETSVTSCCAQATIDVSVINSVPMVKKQSVNIKFFVSRMECFFYSKQKDIKYFLCKLDQMLSNKF